MSAQQLALGLEATHNNHYLFSNHYLNNVLRSRAEWQDAASPAGAFYHWLRDHYQDEKDQLDDYNESQLEDHWLRPILDHLGHTYETQATIPGLGGGIKKPDYVLFPDDAARQAAAAAQNTAAYGQTALAVGEMKQWDVNLSKKTGTAPTFADNNPMYQIDTYVHAAGVAWGILSNGRAWRLVHKDSSRNLDVYFEIDLLAALEQSNETAALATIRYFWLFFCQDAFRPDDRGRLFLDDVLAESQAYALALEADLRDNAYRALEQLILGFFAAAPGLDESDPAHRDRVYRNSLYLLYRLLFLFYGESRGLLPMRNRTYRDNYSLTALAGDIDGRRDEMDDLPATGKMTWARLHELFRLISGVDPRLNQDLAVYRYNGGLFDPERHPFLETHFVGDRHLARAIDHLAYRRVREEGRFKGFQAVDYRTLGVRQLGSIYEGLLEYRVSTAAEEMVAVRKGGVERWLPAGERGRSTVLDRRQPGDLYMATDKGERKATGSYYTPDYIVKYIVAQTLGPLVDEIRQRTRQQVAEMDRRGEEERRRAGADLFVQEILALDVLDPAMGSGHFLVEATNFLARALATDEYVQAGRNGAAADGAADSDLTYWQRRVVEACIYGVDKNEMAVELAKLSLWLVTVASDRPLSFLDHHLRHGDSLVGAWLDDLDAPPRGAQTAAVAAEQEPLFDESAFTRDAGLAVGGVMAIERATSDSIDAIHTKERVWAEVRETHLARWQQLADLWVSAYFGNEMGPEEYRALAGRLQGRDTLLGDAQARAFLDHPAVRANDYFHWELAFPEVFFDEHGNRLGDPAGFDAVVGNPPYDVLSSKELGYDVSAEVGFYGSREIFAPATYGKNNLYKLFLSSVGHALVKDHGYLGFIVPLALLGDRQASALREWLLDMFQLKRIEAFPQKDKPNDRVFPEAKLSTCVFISKKITPDDPFFVRTHPGRIIAEDSPCYTATRQDISTYDPLNKAIPIVSEDAWKVARDIAKAPTTRYLLDIGNCFQGEVNISSHKKAITTNPNDAPLIKGSQVGRYEVQAPSQGQVEWLDETQYATLVGDTPKSQHHRSPRLVMQGISGVDDSRRLVATLCPEGTYLAHSTNYFVLEDTIQAHFLLALINSSLLDWRFRQTSTNNNINSYEVEALPIPRIESTTVTDEQQRILDKSRKLYDRHFEKGDFIHIVDFVAHEMDEGHTDIVHDLLAYLAQQMIAMNEEKQHLVEDFWLDLEGVADPDTFAPLRHKGKWEQSLHKYVEAARPFVAEDSRSTVHLDLSLGWNEDAFKGFVKQLAGKTTTLSALVHVYRDYHPRYRALAHRLQATDTLIDQVVYRLYSLTEEEIAIVEGTS